MSIILTITLVAGKVTDLLKDRSQALILSQEPLWGEITPLSTAPGAFLDAI